MKNRINGHRCMMVLAWIVAALSAAPSNQAWAGEIAPPPPPPPSAASQFQLIAQLEPEFDALWPQDGPDGPRFGHALAIHGDTMVVGAPAARSHPDFSNGGAAFIFERVGAQWTLTQRFPQDFITLPGQDLECGFSVAVDRFNILIGCPGQNGQAGSSVLLTRPSTAAPFELANVAFNAGSMAGERCGHSASLLGTSDSGSYPLAAIGCPGRQPMSIRNHASQAGTETGGVDLQFYCIIFTACAAIWGPGWHVIESFDSSSPVVESAALGFFGASVKLASYMGVNILLAVGDSGSLVSDSRVDVYRASTDDLTDWTLDFRETAPPWAELGASVDILARDTSVQLAAGAPSYLSSNGTSLGGGVRLATRTFIGWGAGSWVQSFPIEGISGENRLGRSVAVMAGAGPARVAMGENRWPGFEDQGRVRHYHFVKGNWELQTGEPFYATQPPPGSEAGHALAASGPWLVSGAPGFAGPDGPVGRVFVYAFEDGLFSDRFD